MNLSDFKELRDAFSDGSLVVFAGAGVSMGEPANLLNFRNLAEKIAKGTGKTLGENKPEDQFLGELKHSGVDIYNCASKVLNRPGLEPTELHFNLLRLFSTPESVRVVTTNFDLLFERAAEKVFDSSPEVFRAPALPLGNKFSGIIHVHGSVHTPEDMVLTDEDFGRAYLVEGWARRFLVELFRSFTVLFVGYSHNDTIMNYLARALLGSGETRFALTDENVLEKWKMLGIEPVVYPSPDGSHEALYEGIYKLARDFGRGVLDWRREINEIADRLPSSVGEEEKGTIDRALEDVGRTRFFTEAASSPEWIDWLDRNGNLQGLFDNGTLSEPNAQLAHWLAVKFSCDHANRLFDLIGRHGMHLNPDFWYSLARFLGLDKENSWDKETVSRWISLLLATIPKHPHDIVLLWLGERCVKHELFGSMIEVFDAMAARRLTLFAWPNIDGEHSSITADLKLASDHHAISTLWENSLKPNLDRVADPLITNVIGHLERHHFTLSTWGAASRKWNPASMDRSAIEPNEQDKHPKAFDVLIDAARDCMEWLALNQMETAAQLCEKLAVSEAPIARRLAVHILPARKDLTADEKTDWLLSKMDLHDDSAYHELFLAVRKIYPDARPKRRRNIIKAVLAYRFSDEENERKDEYTAGEHFNWLYSLHEAKPDCSFTKKALDKIRKQFPDFHPSEHPDHQIWFEAAGWVGPQSPWTTEELLSRSPDEWLKDLLTFRQTGILGPDRRGLLVNVEEAAKQNFEWGLALASLLAEEQKWDADIWSALLGAWSKTSINEDRHREILRFLGTSELHGKNALHMPVAEVLRALVKSASDLYPPDLLAQASKIAAILWENFDRDEALSGDFEWPTRAINHPAGVLAQFWLSSLYLCRKRQDPVPCVLGEEYSSVLSEIIQDRTTAGRLGRCILAGNFSFLLKADEKWTKDNLLPLFSEYSDEGNYHAVWSGFLVWQSVTPSTAELLERAFLSAVKHFKPDSAQSWVRRRFVEVYTAISVYFAASPLDTFIPRFFDNADREDKVVFAFQLQRHLKRMDETQKREWWRRWLKRYWENRLRGVPSNFDSSETSRMLNCLLHMHGLFPEAVELAIQTPPAELSQLYIVHQMNQSDLWENYPEAVAKLLIYLGTCDLPTYEWYEGRELVEKLLESGISEELKVKLKELVAEIAI